MLPKVEINKGKKQLPNLKFCLRFPCGEERKIDALRTPEDIAGVSRDHYNSWEVFNELIAAAPHCVLFVSALCSVARLLVLLLSSSLARFH